MSGKVTLSGRFVSTLLILQLLKPSLGVHYKFMTACHLTVQGGRVFPLGPELICKAIKICGGGGVSQGGLSPRQGRGGQVAYAISHALPEVGSGAPLGLHGELDSLQLCIHGRQLDLEGAD